MPRQATHRQPSVSQFRDFAITADSPEAVDGYLQLAPRTALHSAVRQLIVLSKSDIVKAVHHQSAKLFPRAETINPSANAFKINVPIVGETKSVSGVFAILPSETNRMHRITTVCTSDFWTRVVRKLVRKSYPQMMPVFFKQNEIRDALLLLEKSLGHNTELRIVDTTMKSMRGNKVSGTERYWEELSVREIFDIATERGLWFTSLKFLVRKRVGASNRYRTISSGRLYKYGEIHFDWLYNEITNYLISTLERFATDRLSLLEKRGIRENNYKVGYPLEISYNDDVFADVQEVRRFGTAISKYRDASKAVFHGNPYYHASVADFLDGSSFEIWVLSPQRIIIVPQAKTSMQALERIISRIFFEFKRGKSR